MPFKVWGVPYETGQLGSTDIYQPVRFNTNLILKAVRIWIIVNDDPTFTNLYMKIYSDSHGALTHAPGKLLHTSTNSLTKSEIITEANGVKEIYFTFNNVNVQGSTWYNFVLNGTGYAPTGDKLIAWRQAFPDPVYSTGLTVNTANLNKFPFTFYAIGAEF